MKSKELAAVLGRNPDELVALSYVLEKLDDDCPKRAFLLQAGDSKLIRADVIRLLLVNEGEVWRQ